MMELALPKLRGIRIPSFNLCPAAKTGPDAVFGCRNSKIGVRLEASNPAAEGSGHATRRAATTGTDQEDSGATGKAKWAGKSQHLFLPARHLEAMPPQAVGH